MIERSGIHATKGYDIFGEKTPVRNIITKAVHNIVDSQNKWFAFCKKMDKSQEDIMLLQNNDGGTLGSLLASQYSESMYRVAVYKYLLSEYLCYYEAPTIIKSRDSYASKASYNKFLATSNIRVIAAWLGVSEEDANREYAYRVNDAQLDVDDVNFPYVKLYTAKTGEHKITKPRKDLDLSIAGTRVVPLFALKEGVDCLYNKASSDFYTVDFFKDGGAKRSINITFSIAKLREVYKDEGKLLDQWEMQYKGNFMEQKNLERGYIRVIEVGTNLDSGATRSINYARIIGFHQEQPDLTYLFIDLDGVLETFKSYMSNSSINVQEVVDMLESFEVGEDRKYAGKNIVSTTDLVNWADAQSMILSTPFIKQLALFMIANPEWFGGYTGETKVYTGESKEDVDIGDVFDGLDDLDFI